MWQPASSPPYLGTLHDQLKRYASYCALLTLASGFGLKIPSGPHGCVTRAVHKILARTRVANSNVLYADVTSIEILLIPLTVFPIYFVSWIPQI